MGGPGGRRGPGGFGGRGGPVSASASGAEIYQQKCQGCHGADGQGGRAPALAGGGGRSADELKGIIQNGKGKMPPFGSQLTADQINKVVTHLQQLKSGGAG
jgi:mono/diheme cytochrome c family protein